MKMKALMMILAAVTILWAQIPPYSISGTIKVRNQISPDPVFPGLIFKIIFQGGGSYPTDSASAGPSYNISPYQGYRYGKQFSLTWGGKVFIRSVSHPGFQLPKDTFTVLLGSQTPRVTCDFLVIDTGKPEISNINVSPKYARIGDTITLTYTATDNMCLNIKKLIEISYNNGPWIYVDSLLQIGLDSNYTSPGGGFYPNYFIYGESGDWRSNKTQKVVPTDTGLCRFRISTKDREGNQGVGISDTFRIDGAYKINGRITIQKATSASTPLKILFKGLDSYLTDSIQITIQANLGFVFQKTFIQKWAGNVQVISPGYSCQSYQDTLGVVRGNGKIDSIVSHNFVMIDTQGPMITNITIQPQKVMVGQAVNLLFGVTDNSWRVIYKRIEISYNEGPWICVDTVLENSVYFNAREGYVSADRDLYFTPLIPGFAKFRICYGDSSNNKTTVVTNAFQVDPSVSISDIPKNFVAGRNSNVKVYFYDLSGKKIIKGASKYYLLKGSKTINKLLIK